MKKGQKHTPETKELLRYRRKLQSMEQPLNAGVFKKGHIPHNKGIKKVLNPKCKETQFTKENTGGKHPSWLGGVQVPAKDCAYIWIGTNKRKRRPRAVWEEANGKIPKGLCIWHKDGNKYNDKLENLELVTRAVMMKRNARNHGE